MAGINHWWRDHHTGGGDLTLVAGIGGNLTLVTGFRHLNVDMLCIYAGNLTLVTGIGGNLRRWKLVVGI